MGPGKCNLHFPTRVAFTDYHTECTAKALTHRLQKIRSMAKDGEDGSTTQDTNAEKPKAAPKAAKASGAPKKARGGKKAAAEKTSSPAGSEEKYATPPESGRAKPGGTKRDYAKLAGEDEDDDGLSKKVKIEVGEDIGEGLRQGMGDD